MQGWGYMADHAFRNSLPYPTRSGITGLLAAAIGTNRNDPEESAETARLNKLRMTILGLQVGSRGSGRQIRDYHTAQTRNRNGVVIGDATVTRRDYLVDSKFLVMLDGDDDFLDELQSALKNPVWFGTLARRSCVPSSPFLLGRFESEALAVAEIETRIGKPVAVRLRIDEVQIGGTLLRDLPLGFGERRFGQRMIRVASH
jgi:CRISPR system Cascade subunit CasD